MKNDQEIPIFVNRRQLAEFVGVTARWIDVMAEAGTIKNSSKGCFHFADSIRSLLNRHKEKAAPSVERLNAAKARREERKDRQEAGEEISTAMAVRAWEGCAVTWKQRMLRVGNNVQSRIGLTEPQRAAIDDEVRGALVELTKQINYAADHAEAEGDDVGIKALTQ